MKEWEAAWLYAPVEEVSPEEELKAHIERIKEEWKIFLRVAEEGNDTELIKVIACIAERVRTIKRLQSEVKTDTIRMVK